MMSNLKGAIPHGGELVQQVIERELHPALDSQVRHIDLSNSDLINFFNLAWGYYSPLKGFMNSQDYKSVVNKMKLTTGEDWTIPVLLRIDEKKADQIKDNQYLSLRFEDKDIGIISNVEIFKIDIKNDSIKIFGTDEIAHPGVSLFRNKGEYSVSGEIKLFKDSEPKILGYLNPFNFRREIDSLKLSSFSTRNIPHIGHEYIHRVLLETTQGLGILIISGAEISGKFKSEFVYNFYKEYAQQNYPQGRCYINRILLPPIYGGPREAFLQATVLQNLGYHSFVVGRDHAGCGNYYSKYASQEIFEIATGLNINITPFKEPRYCPACQIVTTENSCPHPEQDKTALNGTDIRAALQSGDQPSLQKILRPESIRILKSFHDKQNIFEE